MDHPVQQFFWKEKISKISMVLHSSCWKSEAALPLSNNFLHFLLFLPRTVFSLIAIFPIYTPPPAPPNEESFPVVSSSVPISWQAINFRRIQFQQIRVEQKPQSFCGASALQQVRVQWHWILFVKSRDDWFEKDIFWKQTVSLIEWVSFC